MSECECVTCDDIQDRLVRADERIKWLEQEVSRMHRLLNNPWNWSDSFKTTNPEQ